MKLRLPALALMVALLGVLTLLPLGALAAPADAAASARTGIPVTGTGLVKGLGIHGTFNGTLNITHFAVVNGELVAQGTLSGTLTGVGGRVLRTITNVPVTLPVTNIEGTCDILTLDLGAIHLDLLGLVIDLSPVHLTIVAVPGSGNLLGNLLCAIAHLLDNPTPNLNLLAGLLNRLLGLLPPPVSS
jgi:hypothetical protein